MCAEQGDKIFKEMGYDISKNGLHLEHYASGRCLSLTETDSFQVQSSLHIESLYDPFTGDSFGMFSISTNYKDPVSVEHIIACDIGRPQTKSCSARTEWSAYKAKFGFLD